MKAAGHLFNEEDFKNFEAIEEIVKKRFSLSKDALEYFSKEMYNPTLDEDIYNFFNKHNSSRVYFEIPEELEKTLDSGWIDFISEFERFVSEVSCSYSNYKNNKIKIGKSEFKIPKAIYNYYREKLYEIKKECSVLCDRYKKNELDASSAKLLKRELTDTIFNSLKYSHVLGFVGARGINLLYDYAERYINSDYSTAEENFEVLLDRAKTSVDFSWRGISQKKLNKNKLYFVLSVNFADWFLCSTAENWSSCLALDGNAANFWWGLPGLVGDKNRIMAYITTKEQKEFLGSVKTDKFCYRSWVLKDKVNEMHFVRWFPAEFSRKGLSSFLLEKTGMHFSNQTFSEREINGQSFCSRHPIVHLYNTEGISIFPYQDYTEFSIIGEDTYIVNGSSGLWYKNKDGYSICCDDIYSSEVFVNLFDLIGHDTDVVNAENEISVCFNCGRDSGEIITNEYGDPYCDDCYHEIYCTCEECGMETLREETVHVESEILCDNCYAKEYFQCAECDADTPRNEGFYVGVGEYVCEQCFNEEYFRCHLTNEVYPIGDAVGVSNERNSNDLFLAYIEEVEARGYVFDEEEGIYFKKEYMKWDEKNRRYYHIDQEEAVTA